MTDNRPNHLADSMADPAGQGKAGRGDGSPPGGFLFAEVVERYQTPLLRYVGQILGPASVAQAANDEAEDVVQDAFVRLHQQVQRHGASSIENVTTWLYRVAHNLAIDAGRRRSRQRQAKQAFQAETDTAGRPPAVSQDVMDSLQELVRREAGQRALAELHRLPDQQKQVLLLKIIQGLTFREIAEASQMSIGSVAYHMNQGLATLARRLKDYEVI